MKRILSLIIVLASMHSLLAQTTSSFKFHSDTLNEDRNIRIHLPKSFDADDDVQYPLILVLDGEYLFYSMMGIGEVMTMREIMPESIVVGIDQNYVVKEPYSARWIDCSYDYKTGKLDEQGLKFRSFLKNELIPFLTRDFKAGKFRTIAGHSFTANYVNYFLEDSTFSGFVAISPYIPESVEDHISNAIAKVNRNIYYYLCTGEDDLSRHISQITRQDSVLFRDSENPYFHYTFKNYEGESHMSLAVRGISDALSTVYSDFSPIYTLDFDSTLFENPDLLSFLHDRYENIRTTYGISIPYREDDITSLSWIIEEQEDWDQMRKMGLLEIDLYPESIYGYYMIATVEEKNNNLPLALEYYKKGYAKLGDDVGNKSDFYEDVERVEGLIKENH